MSVAGAQAAYAAHLPCDGSGCPFIHGDRINHVDRQSDEQTGYATENVTAATPDELDALWAWGDAIRWAVDAEASCPCVCHNPPPVPAS